jgi:hypothetical protein
VLDPELFIIARLGACQIALEELQHGEIVKRNRYPGFVAQFAPHRQRLLLVFARLRELAQIL